MVPTPAIGGAGPRSRNTDPAVAFRVRYGVVNLDREAQTRRIAPTRPDHPRQRRANRGRPP